jgi:hypothetical protein
MAITIASDHSLFRQAFVMSRQPFAARSLERTSIATVLIDRLTCCFGSSIAGASVRSETSKAVWTARLRVVDQACAEIIWRFRHLPNLCIEKVYHAHKPVGFEVAILLILRSTDWGAFLVSCRRHLFVRSKSLVE